MRETESAPAVNKNGAQVVETVKRSELNIEKNIDIIRILESRDDFVPCRLKSRDDRQEWRFFYSVKNLTPFAEIKTEPLMEKLRILINVAHLKSLAEEFKISINPNNLYYDVNRMIKVKQRDIREEDRVFDEQEFLIEYKSLIGTVLNAKYKFEDYKKGGLSLLNKDSQLEPIGACTSTDQIVDYLTEQYRAEAKRINVSCVQVKKQTYKVTRLLNKIALAAVVLLLAALLYQNLFVVSKQKVLIEAESAYATGDYITAIKTLDDVAVEDMDSALQYVLATSYIYTSELDDKARSNALSQLSKKGESAYNLYWAHLGRQNFEKACEIANTFTDERLLYYTYSVEYEALSSNSDMSSQDKIARKKELKELLDNYVEEVKEEGKK